MSTVDASSEDSKSSLTVSTASRAEIPDWYPAWARELAGLYYSGSVCLFLLHGNVHDLIGYQSRKGQAFCSLPEFLSRQLFGSWDIVFSYDLGRGLRLEAGEDARRRQEMVEYTSAVLGNFNAWPRDPDQVLNSLEQVISRNLIQERQDQRKRIAFLFEYAQYLVPSGGLNMLARGEASRLVRLISWAQNPYIKRVNMAFCLIANKLSELNERLVQNPHVAALEVPLPDEPARKVFIQHTWNAAEAERFARGGGGRDDHGRHREHVEWFESGQSECLARTGERHAAGTATAPVPDAQEEYD